MQAFFAFTDESGNYEKDRSERFLAGTPFYTRATVIISLDDYLLLQDGLKQIKIQYGLTPNIEVKWQHYGNALKNNYDRVPHTLTPQQLKDYFEKALELLCELQSVVIYYTFTDNKAVGRINNIALLRMHIQNAYQKIQTIVSDKNGFAIVIADDLNDKTKALKQAVYEMTLAGDYVQYTNMKKGLYIDFSNQCEGLQIADICAGVFTASLKYESSSEDEKHKFNCGHDLFFSKVYTKTRKMFFHPPYYDVYKYGVKEIPSGKGETLAKDISRRVEDKLYRDLMEDMYDAE